MSEHSAENDAQAAWLAYRDEYMRTHYLNARQTASRMRRREFIVGYLAALGRVIPLAQPVTTTEHCPECGGVFVHQSACPIPPVETKGPS